MPYELKFDYIIDKETDHIIWLDEVVNLLNNYEYLKKQIESIPPKVRELWID